VVDGLIDVLRNGGGLGTGESYVPVMQFDPLLHRSSCFANVDFSAFTGNPVDYAVLLHRRSGKPPREQLQIGPLGKQLHSGTTRIETHQSQPTIVIRMVTRDSSDYIMRQTIYTLLFNCTYHYEQ